MSAPVGIVIALTGVEHRLLGSLTGQLVDLLTSVAGQSPAGDAGPGEDRDPLWAQVGIEQAVEPPSHPGLARLFPAAYRDDPEAADDFRRYTQGDLCAAKLDHARTLLTTLGRTAPDAGPDDGSDAVEVELNVAEQRAWISCLNDIRLVLGEQLGLTQGTPRETVRQGLAEVYDWLTALQHHLVAEIDPLGADDPGSAGEGT